MNGLPLEQQFFVALQAATLFGLIVRIWWTGLYRVYRYFFCYLFVALLQTAVPFFPLHSKAYLYMFLASEALVVTFYALVVLETYDLVLRNLTGIASAARRYIKVAIVCAVSASLLPLGLEKKPATVPQYFAICERAILSSLLAFVLLSVIFLVYYPVPLNRNALNYSTGFAVYLVAKTVTLFVNNIRYYSWYRQINSILVAVSSACLIFWLFTLSREGEKKTVVVGHRWNMEDEKRILSRLRAINDSLLRTAKK
jgi:hypothetical protein